MRNAILQSYFQPGTYILTSCKNQLQDIESPEEQVDLVTNYHLGKTNHRGIIETYQKLKQQFYWPNMQQTVSKYINNCDVC